MKLHLYILFFVSIISCAQTNKLQDKYSASEKVYIGYLVYENILKCIEKNYPDLSYEVQKNKVWLDNHFGLSKKNAGLFIEEMGISKLSEYESYNGLEDDCKSLDKQTAIILLKNFEKTTSEQLIEANALSFQYKDNFLLEFLDGYTQTFSTKDHPRAIKSDWKIKIPKSWKETEPKNENVMQLFQNDFGLGKGTIVLTTDDIPAEYGKNLDLEKGFKDNAVIDVIKKGFGASKVSVVSFKPINIALLKGFLAVLDIETEHLGVNIKLRQYNYEFFDNNYLYTFQGIVNTSFSADNINDFESLFLLCANSIVVNEKENDVIYLNGSSHSKTANIEIGGKSYEFLFDTGATVTSINQNIFDELYRKGILKIDNFIRKDTVELANGQKILVEFWAIPKLKIGSRTITDIVASVQKNSNAKPLLGMNILNKLNIWKIDLENNKIYLKN